MTATPPSQPSLTEFDQEIERHYRHNFLVNALDGASYWFGYSFIAPTIILPLYLSHFTKNPLIIGLIPFLSTTGFLLPQLFTANFVERTPRKKFFPVNIGLFTERLPVLLILLSTLLFAKNDPVLALGSFLFFYAWYSFGAGFIIVGWQDMIAKIIPVDKRGRFFGITNFVGNASGILSALAVPFVLQRFDFPQGYVIAFAAAAALIFLSWIFLSQTREPPLVTNKPHVSQLDYMRTLPAVVRRDHNFLRYMIFQIIFTLSGMASGFLIVYGSQHWHLSDSQASGYVIAMQVGQAVANLFFGFLADRKGHKLCLELGALINAVSFAAAFLAPDPLWFYPIFFLRGVTFAVNILSGIAIVMEFTGPDDRPTYFGLANTIPGIAGAAAPLMGGWLADSAGYPVMFLVSTVIAAAALVMLRTVREPRHINGFPSGIVKETNL